MLDGSSRLNLATFVTTWMDPEAERLMAETFDKNMIDRTSTRRLPRSNPVVWAMVADLFHAENLRDDDAKSAIGASTIGSSEAVMLGVCAEVALEAAVGRGGRPAPQPGDGIQRAGGVGEVLPLFRWNPVSADGRGPLRRHPQQVVDAVDEDTIGVVGILGTTYTGELEPIADICAALDKLRRRPASTSRCTSTPPVAVRRPVPEP